MKKNIILDLDHTIISAIPLEDFDWTDKNKNKAINFNFHNMDNYYIVFERPKLQEFLDFIFENFNVTIWSAASKNYVLFVIENIIKKNPKRKIKHVLFSYHCKLSKKLYNGGIKKLNILWDYYKLKDFNKENTLIVDDLEDVKKIQKNNCFLIKSFDFTDQDSQLDNELDNVKNFLLKQ